MLKYRLCILFLIATCAVCHSQKPGIEVDGNIQISDSHDPLPKPGTMRWSGTDFLGWNGAKWISLTTGIAFDDQVTDVDGNNYSTIKIGTQEWMATNLRTSKYKDGTVIPMVNKYSSWQNTNSGAWCWYDTSNIHELHYGKLYNWYAVNEGRGVCPAGWHVPTDAELTTLIDFLDPAVVNPNTVGEQSSVSGGKMKEAGHAHWLGTNNGASNESGFTGLPGENRNLDGTFNGAIGYNFGHWWSRTEIGASAWHRTVTFDGAGAYRYQANKHSGMSIRCVKD